MPKKSKSLGTQQQKPDESENLEGDDFFFTEAELGVTKQELKNAALEAQHLSDAFLPSYNGQEEIPELEPGFETNSTSTNSKKRSHTPATINTEESEESGSQVKKQKRANQPGDPNPYKKPAYKTTSIDRLYKPKN